MGGERIVLITGGNGAIGKAIARQIAAQEGHGVVLVCRDEEKARTAVADVRRAAGSDKVWYEIADVSRKASVAELAARWPGKLDVLINNAAVSPRRRQETREGIEQQWATNVLGYLWMSDAFEEALKAAAPSRIVNVASYWAGDLDMDDLEFERRRYNNNEAYRQSKQANRMLTVAVAERLRPYQISVNSCHPGDVDSQLSNDLGFGGSESPDAGARQPVWLALDPAGGTETGKYFERMRETRDRFATDRAAIEKLYARCLSY